MKTAISTTIVAVCLFATSFVANANGQVGALYLGKLNYQVETGVTKSWYQDRTFKNHAWVDSQMFNQVMNNGVLYTYWYQPRGGNQHCQFQRILRSSGKSHNYGGRMYMEVILSHKKETGYFSVPSGGGGGGTGGGSGGGRVASPNIAGVYRDTRSGAVSTVVKTGHNTYRWSSNHGFSGTLTWNGSSIRASDGNYSTNIRYTGNMPNTINWNNGYTWVRQ